MNEDLKNQKISITKKAATRLKNIIAVSYTHLTLPTIRSV